MKTYYSVSEPRTLFLFSVFSIDAMSSLKTLLENEYVPSRLAVTRLVQALAQKGDVQSICAVEKMMGSLRKSIKLSHMLFINNTVLAHIKK